MSWYSPPYGVRHRDDDRAAGFDGDRNNERCMRIRGGVVRGKEEEGALFGGRRKGRCSGEGAL